MRTFGLWLLGSPGGCVKQVPIEIDLAAVGQASPGDVVPRYVELMHEGRGWIRVELPPEVRASAGSEPFRLTTADLPTGRYEAFRFGYTEGASGDPASASSADAGPGAAPVPQETTMRQLFCLAGDDDQIVIQVARTHPSRGGTPLVTLRAPGC
ncbi:MAG: hypothetical protein ABMB14_06855 [Myxococcota bacterium]